MQNLVPKRYEIGHSGHMLKGDHYHMRKQRKGKLDKTSRILRRNTVRHQNPTISIQQYIRNFVDKKQ